MEDNYFVLKNESEGIYKEKGSRFLSFAIPVSNVEEAETKIKELKKKYFSDECRIIVEVKKSQANAF